MRNEANLALEDWGYIFRIGENALRREKSICVREADAGKLENSPNLPFLPKEHLPCVEYGNYKKVELRC